MVPHHSDEAAFALDRAFQHQPDITPAPSAPSAPPAPAVATCARPRRYGPSSAPPPPPAAPGRCATVALPDSPPVASIAPRPPAPPTRAATPSGSATGPSPAVVCPASATTA